MNNFYNAIAQYVQKLLQIAEAYEKADIIVFLVAHSVFKSLPYDDKKIILDFCGIYKK